jgi:hypothetical protein
VDKYNARRPLFPMAMIIKISKYLSYIIVIYILVPDGIIRPVVSVSAMTWSGLLALYLSTLMMPKVNNLVFQNSVLSEKKFLIKLNVYYMLKWLAIVS